MGLTTFSTGLSGLAANSQGLNVTGNNLANLNTTAFKSSSATFSEVLGQSFAAPGGGSINVGLGVQVSSVRPGFSQGGPLSTNRPLDVLIEGKGFFVLNGGSGRYYTRVGNFRINPNGLLVGANNLPVQGFVKDPTTGKIDTAGLPQNILFPAGLSSPQPTTEFELAMNLNANSPAGTTLTRSFQIFDSLGSPHLATLTLEKQATTGTPPTTDWNFDLTIPNNEIGGVAATDTQKFSLITGAVATTPPAAGTLQFDSDGQLSTAWLGTPSGTPPALANLTLPPSATTLPALSNGAFLNGSGITWKLLNSGGSPHITQFAAPSDVSSTTQNGTAAGSPSTISVRSDGTITALFDSGQAVDIARMAVAIFNNPEGLIPRGFGMYSEAATSGSPSLGAAGEGGRGPLTGGALEGSNVDLATELTNIITYQRGYQASARLITVTDQILQETINLRQ